MLPFSDDVTGSRTEPRERDLACQVRAPDFCIVGAPKCGTTAISQYLAGHREILFSRPKEPHFFATDFSEHYRSCTTAAAYEACFAAGVPGDGRRRGEGSVWYLFSQVAIRNLLRANPETRLIVMLRNPIDLAPSLHAQKVIGADEDVTDFATAWRLQAARRAGREIPPGCTEPRLLQYEAACRLGEQLERLYRHADRDQVKVVLFDDFAADPGRAYRDVLAFLGVADDGRQSFPRVKERLAYRMVGVGRFLRRPPPRLVALNRTIKEGLGIERLGVLRRLRALNHNPIGRPPLPADLRAELARTFADDVARLGELLGRDLAPWLAGEGLAR